MEDVEFYLRRAAEPTLGMEQKNKMMQMATLAALREVTGVLRDIRDILMTDRVRDE